MNADEPDTGAEEQDSGAAPETPEGPTSPETTQGGPGAADQAGGASPSESPPTPGGPPAGQPDQPARPSESDVERRTEAAADRLVIESADLVDLPDEPPARAPQAPAGDRLVVELGEDDAGTAPPAARPTLTIDAARLAAMPEPVTPVAPVGKLGTFGKGDGTRAAGVLPIFGSRLHEALVGGVCGGIVAWILGEPLLRIIALASHAGVGRFLAETTLYGLLVGGLIGAALMAVEGVAVRAWPRAYRAAVIGFVAGAGGGAAGGLAAQGIHSALMGSWGISSRSVSGLLLYAVGWSILGVGIGVGQCVRAPSPQAMRRGLLGGAIGGLAGGLAFAAIKMLTGAGAASRMFAVVSLGTSIGLGVGLVERLLREAWLKVVAGPLTGKEFVLDDRRLTIGSGPAADIILARHPNVGKMQAEVVVDRGRRYVRDLRSGFPTRVNGQPVDRHALRSGDLIGIGKAVFRYEERGETKAGTS